MKTKNQQTLENTILQVLTQPTAPFRESWVKRSLLSFCVDKKLPYFEDQFGNFWLGAKNKTELKQKTLVWVAHLDHPGMIIEKFSRSKNRLLAHGKWLGGGPMDIRNKKVLVFSDVDALVLLEGKIIHTTPGVRSVDLVTIELKKTPLAEACCNPTAHRALGFWGACLWYSDAGVPQGVVKSKGKNPHWITKAADDLIGASVLLTAFAQTRPKNSVALLSRAEESGFHGTLAILEEEMLSPTRTQMISIETSSRLPGAEPGLGPVVRQGDRMGIFDPEMVGWVNQVAVKSKIPFQKRIMDGGTCEASAFSLYGFKVGGLSTPLINYHNVGPKQKALPEEVSVQDVERLEKLVVNLIRDNEKTPGLKKFWRTFSEMKKKLLKNHNAHVKYFMMPLAFLLAGFSFSINQASAADLKNSNIKILFIGDSHSQGPIGNKLFDRLKNIPQVDLRFYSSCGSAPWTWLGGLRSYCGISSRDQNNKPLLPMGAVYTPHVEDLLNHFQPDLTIIEQGGNMMPVYRLDPAKTLARYNSARRNQPLLDYTEKEAIALLEMVQIHSKKCIWMGPPYSRRFVEDTFNERYDLMAKWSKEAGCDFIDNRGLIDYPATGGDGLHYSDGMSPEIKKMTTAVADHSFEMILDLLNRN